jgi:hypothetical protein
MAIPQTSGQPWTRKHDNPMVPTVPAAPTTMFPTSLEDLIQICATRPPGQRARAAGSHWALSKAAIADSIFIETHDPNNLFQAMDKTLFDVVPGCLADHFIGMLASLTPTFDPTSFQENEGSYLVHFETGKRIFQLYSELDQGDDNNPQSLAALMRDAHNNPSYLGPWAFATLGGAGGQTVFGALTTGTHGADFRFPPIAGSVLALHLVADGGRHFWIEPKTHATGTMTDDAKLTALFGQDKFRGNQPTGKDNFQIIRDNDVFNSVLIAAGRFGIVYSVVMRAVRQYSLHEQRRLTTWQAVKGLIADPTSDLFKRVSPPPNEPFKSRSLQIAVSVTPIANFTKNLAGITKRWNVPLFLNPITHIPAGRAERSGANAGTTHPYEPGTVPGTAADPSFLEQACANANFVQGVVQEVITEINNFISSNGAVIGGALAADSALGGGSLLALIPFLLALLALLELFLKLLASQSDPRFGQTLNKLKDILLNQSDPGKRAAGILIWQMIAFKIFSSQQADRDYEAISYAVMDGHDYLDKSCDVNVDSIEVFFDAADPMVVAFVDALLAFEVAQENNGKAFVGYISLRFTGPTAALLGEERHAPTCVIEVAGLKDVTGVTELIDFAISLALDPNFKGILHWGQRNESNRQQIEDRFGDTLASPAGNLQRWRSALSLVTRHGKLDGFSSAFTRQTGLEIVTPQIASLNVVGAIPHHPNPITIGWNCDENPPGTTVRLDVLGPNGLHTFGALPLVGTHQVAAPTAGLYKATLVAAIDLGGEHREVNKVINVSVV